MKVNVEVRLDRVEFLIRGYDLVLRLDGEEISMDVIDHKMTPMDLLLTLINSALKKVDLTDEKITERLEGIGSDGYRTMVKMIALIEADEAGKAD